MKAKQSTLHGTSLIALLTVALAFAGLALVPTARADAPATFHVTIGASSPDRALMGMVGTVNVVA